MKTASEVRAEVMAAREIALKNFRDTWGTDSVEKVMYALAQTIPGSANPQDAAVKARKILG